MANDTQTDRLKSVRNRCVIEVYDGVFCVAALRFGFVCGCRGFCYTTESDFFLFISHSQKTPKSKVRTQKQHQNFDSTMIADQLRTVSWRDDSNQTDVVKLVNGIPTFRLTTPDSKWKLGQRWALRCNFRWANVGWRCKTISTLLIQKTLAQHVVQMLAQHVV